MDNQRRKFLGTMGAITAGSLLAGNRFAFAADKSPHQGRGAALPFRHHGNLGERSQGRGVDDLRADQC